MWGYMVAIEKSSFMITSHPFIDSSNILNTHSHICIGTWLKRRVNKIAKRTISALKEDKTTHKSQPQRQRCTQAVQQYFKIENFRPNVRAHDIGTPHHTENRHYWTNNILSVDETMLTTIHACEKIFTRIFIVFDIRIAWIWSHSHI